MKNLSFALPFFALCASLSLSSCSKESEDIVPAGTTTQSTSNATKDRPLPCNDYDHELIMTGNGNRIWRQEIVRDDYITRTLLDLNYEVYMLQTKYVIAPAGIETSVWEGVIPNSNDIPKNKTVFKANTWNECGKYFESECEKFPNGKIILTLVHQANDPRDKK